MKSPPALLPVEPERASWKVAIGGMDVLDTKTFSRKVLPFDAVVESAEEKAFLMTESKGGPTPKSPLSALVVAFEPGAETAI